MLRYRYVPFDGELNQLQGAELASLRGVAEGWYVEYKSDALRPQAIGKHLASFANQHGGWLLFGVKEDSEDRCTAAAFPGIPSERLPQLMTDVREAASRHVKPFVYYELKAIDGPIAEIGLPQGSSILVVGVPEGDSPPYVHSSGRIYRRAGDSSQPVEENDRYSLDRLWERGQRVVRNFELALSNTPRISKKEEGGARAIVYFAPNPYAPAPKRRMTFEEFRSHLTNGGSIDKFWMQMDHISVTKDGFLARHVKDNDPQLAVASLRWWHAGLARCVIPINVYSLEDFAIHVGKSPNAERFHEIALDQGFRTMRIADLSVLLKALVALSSSYLNLRFCIDDSRDISGRIIIQNSWRLSPYLDDPAFVARVKQTGVPVVEDTDIRLPDEARIEDLIPLLVRDAPQERDIVHTDTPRTTVVSPFLLAWPIGRDILIALGAICDPSQIADANIWNLESLHAPRTGRSPLEDKCH